MKPESASLIHSKDLITETHCNKKADKDRNGIKWTNGQIKPNDHKDDDEK